MDQLYVPLLAIHNILRWAVVLTALYALFTYITGWMQNRDFTPSDRRAGSFYTISMDVQLLVGLLLYGFVSPITRVAFMDPGAAMRDSQLRFFLVEHMMLMVIAVVLVHVGSVMARRGATAQSKFKRGAIWYTLGFLAVLAAIPWDRPLLPF